MVRVKNVSLRVGDFRLESIDFSVEEGGYCVILGPTGAGKTLLIESIAGLVNVCGGKIFLDGKDVTKLPPERRGIGYLPQDYALFPFMNVRRNIGIGLKLKGLPRSEIERKIKTVCRELGIEHLLNRMPGNLSGGEKQRVALARALVLDPEVLLLDEPYSSIDTGLKRSLWWFIKRLHKKIRKTIIHITHDLEEAYTLAEKIGIIIDGRLVQFGPKETVFRYPKTPAVAKLLGISNILSAEVIATEGKGIIAKWKNHSVTFYRKNSAGNVGKGKKLHFCIRPEEIEIIANGHKNLVMGGNGSGNIVNGEIVAMVPYGMINTLYFRAAGGGEGTYNQDYDFEIKLTRDKFEDLNLYIGKKVSVKLVPERIHLFE